MNVNVHVQIFLNLLLTNFIVSLSYLIGDRKTANTIFLLKIQQLFCCILPRGNAEKEHMGKCFYFFTTFLPHSIIGNCWVAYDIVTCMKIATSTQAKII